MNFQGRQVWAIDPAILQADVLPKLQNLLDGKYAESEAQYNDDARKRKRSLQTDDGELQLSTGSAMVEFTGRTAIVPITGVITKRADFFTFLFGGTSSDSLREIAGILADLDMIDNVLFNIDSPGGEVGGLVLATEALRDLRKRKAVGAFANDGMMSAAYMLGSASDFISVNPSSQTGSIGALAIIQSIDGMLTQMGIDTRIVRAGKFKAVPNFIEPITDTGVAIVQEQVNKHYADFVQAVSLNRKISMSDAQNLADGLVFEGETAIGATLADSEGTIEAAIEALEAKEDTKGFARLFTFMSKAKSNGHSQQPSVPRGTESDTSLTDMADNDTQERITALEEQLEKATARVEEFAAIVSTQSAVIASNAARQVQDENRTFIEETVKEGKIKASHAPGLVATLNLLAGLGEDATIAFGAADEQVKTNAFDFMRGFLAGQIPIVDYNEHSGDEKNTGVNGKLSKDEIVTQAKVLMEEYAEKGQTLSADRAVHLVTSQN